MLAYVASVLIAAASPVSAGACSGLGGLADKLWGAGSGYDKLTRPALAKNITHMAEPPREDIEMQIEFFSLSEVNELQQSITIEVYLRAVWEDARLDPLDLSCLSPTKWEVAYAGSYLQNIWVPDLVVANLLGEEITLSSAFWITTGGEVWWVRRVILTLSCKMDFTNLPFDVQRCPVKLHSVRDGNTQVAVGFFDSPAEFTRGHTPGGDVEFNVTSIAGQAADSAVFGYDDYYSGVIWFLEIKRIPSYYQYYVLIPSYVMVCISWFSFFISRASAPARVAMTVIIFLTLNALINSVSQSFPKQSGSVWLLSHLQISTGFVMFSIVEYAVVNWLFRIESRLGILRAEVEKDHVELELPWEDPPESLGVASTTTTDTIQTKVRRKGTLSARLCANIKGHMWVADQHVDIASRLLFPFAYAIFVAAHWAQLDRD